jgi:hypothetical protein
VDAALRNEANAKSVDGRRAAVLELVELVRKIGAATDVPRGERMRQRNRIRGRLGQLQRELARRGGERGGGHNRPPLLAQVGPPPGGGGANPPPPADHGEDLAELIRQTIAPETWDVNGGNGVIVYFPSRRVLVVRQQAEVHWGLADVLNQLHGN